MDGGSPVIGVPGSPGYRVVYAAASARTARTGLMARRLFSTTALVFAVIVFAPNVVAYGLAALGHRLPIEACRPRSDVYHRTDAESDIRPS